MEQKIREFMTLVSEQLRRSPGSIEMIRTCGTSALEEASPHWIEFAVSNLMEIHANVGSMIDMIRRFAEYDDKPSQFMYDFTEIMDDLAFHAAVFNVYFFSIEGVIEALVPQPIRKPSSELDQTVSMDNYLENIGAIARVWDLNVNSDQKRSLLMNITLESLNVTRYFELLFATNDNSRGAHLLWYLRCLCRAITALQSNWSVIKCI